MSDEELEMIRQRKLMQLQQQIEEAQGKEQIRKEMEAQKDKIMRSILSPEARSRLANIKMVKPEFAEQVEIQLIRLAQNGQLVRAGYSLPMSDEQFKTLLSKLQSKKRDIRIKFR